MRSALAVVLGLVLAAPLTGCRAIALGGKQDVVLTIPKGETVYVDGTVVAPGTIRLKRNRSHVISTDWGWSQKIDMYFAWEVLIWGVLLTGPFELVDFFDGSAFYLDPTSMKVPERPADNPTPKEKRVVPTEEPPQN